MIDKELPPIRTSDQQYEHDMREYGLTLFSEEKAVLVEQARAGDMRARQDICLSFLDSNSYLAAKYARAYSWACPRIEYQDLAQLANETVLSVLDIALSKEKPFGYIAISVQHAILAQCLTHATLISRPIPSENAWKYPYLQVISLDAPQFRDDGTQYSFADTLANTLLALAPDEKEYPLLDAFINALPERQRETVLTHYGLREHAPERIADIARARGQKPDSVSIVHRRALANLRRQMEAAS
jgi:DNA-directed RNA polymerase specialized sigma24 family protein